MTHPTIISFLSFVLLGCHSEQAHDDYGHEHGGHNHGEEAESVTVWTDTLEAFIKYDPLKPKKPSRLLIHLTWLDGHRPVTEGTLTVHLEDDGVHNRVVVDEPTRRGIFIPTLEPSAVQNAKLWLELNSEGQTERIDLATVSVPKPGDGHEHESNQETISFFKEQAWDIPFQTKPVTNTQIYQTIEALGQWTARPEDWYTVIAPATGTVSFGESIPHLGAKLSSKEHVLTIQSDQLSEDSLSLKWQETQVQWRTVQSEYERNKPLREQGVLSQAQWEIIEHRYLTTKAQYDRLSSQTYNGRSIVKNPVQGRVSELHVSAGDYVEQGSPLYKMVTQAPSLLHLSIPHRHHDALKHIQQVEVQIDGEWTVLKGATTNVGLSLGEHHTIPVQVFTTPQDHVFAEEKTPVRLVFGDPTPQLVVPASSLLEEYGQYSVIQQLGGEEFAIQPVTIGERNGDLVAVKSGLNESDWVVSTGNYIVKMVSESGELPAHGHAH